MSPATLDTYIDWVVEERLLMDREEFDHYSKLARTLLNIEFVWSHPMDENRAADGLGLREDFSYETGLYLDKSSGLLPGCTVFEMLVALAYKCEDQIMLNYTAGRRVSRWWYVMIENLGLDKCTDDEWTTDTADYICDKVDKFMHCDYKMNGSGGLFPLKKRGIRQKENDIWKQLTAYLNENYL